MNIPGIGSKTLLLLRKTFSGILKEPLIGIQKNRNIHKFPRLLLSLTATRSMPPIASLAGAGGKGSGGGDSSVGPVEEHQQHKTTAFQQSKSPVLRISVDGNISSGKSTLVTTLVELLPKETNFQVEIVPEPLDKWTNLKGHNLLDKLYKDVAKNNFMFQHYVQLTRLVDTVKPAEGNSLNGNSGTVRIMERSLQNNRYCFTELARRQGTLQEAEFAVLAEWYKWLGEKIDLSLDLIIYLRTSPDTVFARMKGRGRAEESTVPVEYLSALHDTYEDWLVNNTIPEEAFDSQRKRHVIIIDANQTKENVAKQCRLRIQEFLNEITTGEQELNK